MDELHQRMFDRRDKRERAEYWSAESDVGVVAAGHYLAAQAGVQMLRDGGNAIDAAAAVSFALGVCEPAASGLGGMAVLVVYLAESKRTFTIEGPCRAPLNATPEIVARSNRYRGYTSIAVPAHVATIAYALHKYGTMSPRDVLQPALLIAEQGYPITHMQNQLMHEFLNPLREQSGGAIMLQDGTPRQPGDILRQPALANTLARLGDAGFEDFYTGEIAQRICDDMRAHGGFIIAQDLADIPWPIEREPLTSRFGDTTLCTVGPPAGGTALAQLGKLYTAYGSAIDLQSPHDAALVAAMIRKVRKDRRAYSRKIKADSLGNVAKLLDAEYAAAALRAIQESLPGEGETSHVSIVDRFGNAVAMTQSIERSYGSGVVTADLGFFYNGYVRAFKVQNNKHPHYLVPGAPARSNAAPTIVFRDDAPWAVIGSTGSERMASGIFTTLLRLQTSTPFAAVAAPRLHCTPEGQVRWEAERFPPDVRAELSRQGYELDPFEGYAFGAGGLQLVTKTGDRYCAVADPRRDGAAMGVGENPSRIDSLNVIASFFNMDVL